MGPSPLFFDLPVSIPRSSLSLLCSNIEDEARSGERRTQWSSVIISVIPASVARVSSSRVQAYKRRPAQRSMASPMAIQSSGGLGKLWRPCWGRPWGFGTNDQHINPISRSSATARGGSPPLGPLLPLSCPREREGTRGAWPSVKSGAAGERCGGPTAYKNMRTAPNPLLRKWCG